MLVSVLQLLKHGKLLINACQTVGVLTATQELVVKWQRNAAVRIQLGLHPEVALLQTTQGGDVAEKLILKGG